MAGKSIHHCTNDAYDWLWRTGLIQMKQIMRLTTYIVTYMMQIKSWTTYRVTNDADHGLGAVLSAGISQVTHD